MDAYYSHCKDNAQRQELERTKMPAILESDQSYVLMLRLHWLVTLDDKTEPSTRSSLEAFVRCCGRLIVNGTPYQQLLAILPWKAMDLFAERHRTHIQWKTIGGGLEAFTIFVACPVLRLVTLSRHDPSNHCASISVRCTIDPAISCTASAANPSINDFSAAWSRIVPSATTPCDVSLGQWAAGCRTCPLRCRPVSSCVWPQLFRHQPVACMQFVLFVESFSFQPSQPPLLASLSSFSRCAASACWIGILTKVCGRAGSTASAFPFACSSSSLGFGMLATPYVSIPRLFFHKT